MALPSTGPISMSQVRTELGLSGSISLGQSEVRALAGRSSGSISMSHLRGKSAVNWEGTLNNLPSTMTHTRYTVGASSGYVSFFIRGNGTFLGNETNSNASINPPVGSILDQITGSRWDNSDAETRTNTECKFSLLGVTNNGGNTGRQFIGANSDNWISVGTYRSVICELPNLYNDNSYRFNLSIRSSANPSNVISKNFTLRVINTTAPVNPGGPEGPIA